MRGITMTKPIKKKPGRKRIGQPISLTVTPEQREYLDSLIQPGGTRTEAIRRIIQQAMDQHDERKVS